MTLQKDQPKPPQNRTQKIVMYSVFGVAAILAIIAIVLAIVTGARLF
ncbi:MAG: hypothetical protein JWR53_983 [Glaciihabitans sp.]|jgi:hypothetical protein|nr:hypothetical protein [Glaciihabitans sp.]MDQ1555591.1 hypothetical protein [Actinomycetota bacterium]